MTEKLQALMDQAYSRWQADANMSQEDFWDTLGANERLAVFVGNFNYQVCNGGFIQWHDNDYAKPVVLDYLERLCQRMDTKVSHTVAGLLSEFRLAQKEFIENERDEDAWPEFSSATDMLCNQFYKINDAWLVEVEATL